MNGFEKFTQLAARHNLVPVTRELIIDLDTPLTIFSKVAADQSHAFLFESLEGGEKWGRYSFIGFDPLVIFASRGDQVLIRRLTPEAAAEIDRPPVFSEERRCGDPLQLLEQLLAELNPAVVDGSLPRFNGGAVGFLGYDMVRFMERLPDENPPLADCPDSSFLVPRVVLVYDNLRQRLTVVNWVVTGGDNDLARLYDRARQRLDRLEEALRQPLAPELLTDCQPDAAPPHNFTANMSPDQFKAMVEKAKEYIRAGDVIQVVLSQRFQATTSVAPLRLYRALRHINPSPYLFYLKLGDLVQIGSSPEILVRLEGEQIELRPIAGTRPRGRNAEEDLALEQELLADPKERAEHLMLVDLGRNDVGRVARYGSVEVRDLLVIERYSHVMHIVSGVHGRLAEGRNQFDVVRACFPAGTVSGAPKVRAMEIIEELEPQRRGPYAGAVGYFGFTGNMDFCITIRTFVLRGDELWVQAGAGIVADSDPESEYTETVNKSMGLRRALQLAEMDSGKQGR
ncbi:anthranilate synthase component I [Desulfurivibrio alkaliphilus]|uniref:Anthranilate synthase component 1 n=1 Tax=Desulfurivibrio alkaliphilus (strain DSM 19089 / UNIQEM U267 / AHT2) TaxID=589865 RepID=D6YZZ6_DESAT|nr:anthranilate synthase component I [Desulfurivibrio alkaliphilus]ADH85153.1 anthranilate synthase component I [Desulfurivibrio alkaliphilus AHT 2]